MENIRARAGELHSGFSVILTHFFCLLKQTKRFLFSPRVGN